MNPQTMQNWLNRKGWSQRRGAHALGVSLYMMKRWLSGAAPIPILYWAFIDDVEFADKIKELVATGV